MAALLKQTMNVHTASAFPAMLKPIQLFDVTLRDGLQSLSTIYSLNHKKRLLDKIIKSRLPDSIEVGSIVSSKILPQMSNSIELYKYAEAKYPSRTPKFYMLIPNERAMNIAISNGVRNASFITSVSDSFQKKNINQTLDQTKTNLSKMFDKKQFAKTKLYISCIPSCPIEGKISIKNIVGEILHYRQYSCIDEFCLSDTCGTLDVQTIQRVLSDISDYILPHQISLHLHVNPKNNSEVQKIICHALDREIYKFDVSYFPNIGGCSVTMSETSGNLTYEMIDSVVY